MAVRAARRWLRWALRLPAFVLATLALYWAMVLALLTGRVNLLRRRGRNDPLAATSLLMRLLRVRPVRASEGQLYRGGRCLYLCNHRSWADFFIDLYLTEGRAIPLSRTLVAVAFPALVAPLLAVRGILVFNRKKGSKGDVEGFNRWLDKKLRKSPHDGILVYPEGHRGTGQESQPLRRGMLHYAHSRGMPVQIVMSANKEAVLAEREDRAGLGQAVVTSYSEVIRPTRFDDFEAFAADVQRAWGAEWKRAYAAPLTGLPPVRVGRHPLEYTPTQQARSALVLLLWTAAFTAWPFVSWRLAAWLGAALPAAGPALLAGALVWGAASLWASSYPVDRRRRADRRAAKAAAVAPVVAPSAAGAAAAAGREAAPVATPSAAHPAAVPAPTPSPACGTEAGEHSKDKEPLAPAGPGPAETPAPPAAGATEEKEGLPVGALGGPRELRDSAAEEAVAPPRDDMRS